MALTITIIDLAFIKERSLGNKWILIKICSILERNSIIKQEEKYYKDIK